MNTLRVSAVAKKLDVHVNTVYVWVRDYGFPNSFKLGGVSVWDEADVDAWIKHNKEMQNGSTGKENGDQHADPRPADRAA